MRQLAWFAALSVMAMSCGSQMRSASLARPEAQAWIRQHEGKSVEVEIVPGRQPPVVRGILGSSDGRYLMLFPAVNTAMVFLEGCDVTRITVHRRLPGQWAGAGDQLVLGDR